MVYFSRWGLLSAVVVFAVGGAGCNGCTTPVCSTAECLNAMKSACDSKRTDNATRDTDCDGLSDAEEFTVVYANGLRTDPCNADTDGDGLTDGVEMGRTTSLDATCGFVGDVEPASKTSPVAADTDGDGLRDGEEDKNHNGRVDAGESNPVRKDSDCDGLTDAEEVHGAGCATDPLLSDTDGDGISDGIEAGLAFSVADAMCAYGSFDADPSTRSNGCKADTDGDGVSDGAEDVNHNGRVEAGELDPLDARDAAGPVAQACASANLRGAAFESSNDADIQVALTPTTSQRSQLSGGDAGVSGFVFYDPANHIAGLALARAPVGATALDEETDVRNTLRGLSGAIVQTFTTWDRFSSSARASYDQSATIDLKDQVNEMARVLAGVNLEGLFTEQAGLRGPFRIQAQFVRRTDRRTVLLFAVTPANEFLGDRVFRLADVAAGAALAQVGDLTTTQCEVFRSAPPASVDFLWVVDDSCSMAGYQNAVGLAGNVMVEALASAGLDWRAGGVTTGFYVANDPSEYRPFTTQMPIMQQWFTQGSSSWFGTGGTGTEESLLSAQQYLQTQLLPKTSDPALNKLRVGSDLHLIVLGDADDQSSPSIANFTATFANYDGAASKAIIHGLVCPQGQTCGETQANPRRNLEAIASSGGVLGDINVAQSGNAQLADTLSAIIYAAIVGTGHQVAQPPIGATVKVAIEQNGTVGVCNVNDVPRDRQHGFDFDAATQRLVFFGNCRPNGPGKKIALSYRAWTGAP